MIDRLELLPVTLLDSERERVDALKTLASQLKLEFGWHYLLDITWILRNVKQIHDRTIIDAGAGTGLVQWYLAEHGANVISVDRESREHLAMKFRRRYLIEGFRPEDLKQARTPTSTAGNSLKSTFADRVDQARVGIGQFTKTRTSKPGKVMIFNQDLANLAGIENDSIDTVVAVSSLEHNSPDGLERVVAELMRVLKPGGALIATLGAARDEDWFHEPSQGWCYSESTLRRIFNISSETQSNYSEYDSLMEQLTINQELKDNLASFYFKSGNNGMPWGQWNPEYQPVGVCKIKHEAQIVR